MTVANILVVRNDL